MTTEMQIAGRRTGQGLWENTTKPSLIMTPHVAVGGRIPIPMNERIDSASIAPGIAKASDTMTGARAFGNRCRIMIRFVGTPVARAASMNSFSLSDSTWPRTSRVRPTQFTTARATKMRMRPPMMSPSHVLRSVAMMMITKSRSGNA